MQTFLTVFTMSHHCNSDQETAELNILDPSSYIEPWEDESIMMCIHYSKGNLKPYKVILKGNRNGAEWNVYVPSHLRTPSHLQTGRRQIGRSHLPTFCPIYRHFGQSANIVLKLRCSQMCFVLWFCELCYVILQVVLRGPVSLVWIFNKHQSV